MNRSGGYRRLPLVTWIIAALFFSIVTTPAWSQVSASDQQQGTASGAGMQVASAVSTILYFPFKGAFAIGGAIVGGLAYAFSGGSEQTAKSIWIPSMYGTYVITPEHLTGDRPVRFLGVAADSEYQAAEPVQ
ncbi:MAG: hypothetical protein OEY21_09285 [Nitrospira sp.]|nr:hypothetical protein [Nitrospira sp.]